MFSTSTNIVLIGMPGSGKTTVGQILAELLDLPFHDSDALIAKSLGLSIPDIFSQKGEAYFRHNEALTCCTLLKHSEGIIALGGGSIVSPEVRSLLAMHTVIYLQASVPTLCKRLAGDTERPLLSTGDCFSRLESLAYERLPLYEAAAAHRVITDRKAPLAIGLGIMESLGVSLEVHS